MAATIRQNARSGCAAVLVAWSEKSRPRKVSAS